MVVTKQLASTGAVVPLDLGVDYSVNTLDLDDDNGGTINFLAPQLPAVAGDVWTLSRNTAIDRSPDFATSGDFLAVTINEQLDELTRIAQDSSLESSTAVRKDPGVGDTLDPLIPQPVDERALKFRDTGGGNFEMVMSENDPDQQANAAAASAAAALASEQAAATSETNAGNSETAAGISETNAGISETNAGISETNAGNSETAAAISETNAANSETAAGNSETAAGISETNAATSETNAATSETNAGNSETAAGISETNAAASEVAAAASAAQLQGTSTTSITIGLGTKVFTTQAGKFFDAGTTVLIFSEAVPFDSMSGNVTSYIGTSLTVNVTSISGSGTISDWNIHVSGVQGAQGPEGSVAVAKNLVMNGNFEVSQRATSFTAISFNEYSLDRYQHVISVTAARVDVIQSGDTPDGLSENSMKIDVNTIDVTVGAADAILFDNNIEGFNTIPLGFGTSDAKTVTLSFHVKSSLTGIYCVALQNNAFSRTYTVEYTVNTANTWEKKTFTIVGDTTGTWLKTNARGMRIRFSLMAGSDFQGTPNTWQANDNFATSNQVNFMATLTNEIFFSRIQLEIGTTASDFENVAFGDEIARCQRYFCRSYDYGVATGTVTDNGMFTTSVSGVANAAHSIQQAAQFPVIMRAAPTMTFFSPAVGTINRLSGTGGADTVINGSSGGMTATLTNATTGVTPNPLMSGHFLADAEL